jgi:hypothetical protein
VALPVNVGVGDVIQYDANGDSSVDTVAFIHRRVSSNRFEVQNSTGANPVAVATDNDWSVFRAYTSLADAESGSENVGIDGGLSNFDTWSGGHDLVTNDLVWNIACYGDAADTTAVTIGGWTTGPSNVLRVFVPIAPSQVGTRQRHHGVWDTSYYHRVVSGRSIRINDGYVRLEGLQTRSNGNFFLAAAVQVGAGAASDVRINATIITAPTATGTDWAGVGSTFASPTVRFFNNLVFDINPGNGEAVCMRTNGGTWYVYNNTFHGCGRFGVSDNSGSSILAKNNLVQAAADDDYDGTFVVGSNFNISSDIDTSGGAQDRPNTSVAFVDAVGKDFHLSDGDNQARNNGTDLSADPNLSFTDDVDGDARPGGQWDIGFDEHVP